MHKTRNPTFAEEVKSSFSQQTIFLIRVELTRARLNFHDQSVSVRVNPRTNRYHFPDAA